MKRNLLKICAVIMAIYIVIACLPAISVAAAQPSTYSKEYNSGTRNEVCTTLSGTSASSYYTGSYTYENLSTLSSSALKTSLSTLMTNTHSYKSTYGDCHYKADRTDCQNGDGSVSLIYTSYSASMSQWNGWNREHVWPQSLGGGNADDRGGGADLHHVRPADYGVNSSRGNKPYGESGSNANSKYGSNPAVGVLGGTYNSTYFEPLDNVKGDVARICLYVHVRWGSDWGADDITKVFESVDVLLEWCELDPVDTWEMGRNEVVQNIQGNRNVFIDYPEYAWLIFGEEVPSDMATPSGKASNGTAGGNQGGNTDPDTPDTPDTPVVPPTGEDGKVAIFDFGANGSPEHVDGEAANGSVQFTSGSYTLTLSGLNRVYIGATDATGNSCIKVGASSGTGSLSFTVGDEVDKVVLQIAKYKAKTSKISINGAAYELSTSSNDGEYTEITVDTSSTKTVTLNTVGNSTGRCMINTIEFFSTASRPDNNDPGSGDTDTDTDTETETDTDTETDNETTPDVKEHEWGDWIMIDVDLEVRRCNICGEYESRKVTETDTETEAETNAPSNGETDKPEDETPAPNGNGSVAVPQETEPGSETSATPTAEKEGGCGSSLAGGAIVISITSLAALAFVRKKKEN